MITTIAELQELSSKKREENAKNPREIGIERNSAFYTKQRRIVLENEGLIDPDDIEDYIGHGGYFSLFRALR